MSKAAEKLREEIQDLEERCNRAHTRLVFASAGLPRKQAYREYARLSRMLENRRRKLEALTKKEA